MEYTLESSRRVLRVVSVSYYTKKTADVVAAAAVADVGASLMKLWENAFKAKHKTKEGGGEEKK